jgi:hypothetical protein
MTLYGVQVLLRAEKIAVRPKPRPEPRPDQDYGHNRNPNHDLIIFTVKLPGMQEDHLWEIDIDIDLDGQSGQSVLKYEIGSY